MSIDAAWGHLREYGLDVPHNEVREGGPGEGYAVMEKHRGYVVRPCATCREPFIVGATSDATTCGGHRCE